MDKLTIFLALLFTLLFAPVSAAKGASYIIPLHVADDPTVYDPGANHRDQQPFYDTCTITDEGISFSSTEESEIVAYELYDQKGSCLGHFCDQADFLTALFSRPGTYEVRFQTEKAVLLGCVQI